MKLLPLGAIVLLGLVSGAAACNFIYESQLKDYSGECKFEGRGTECGTCIANNCRGQLGPVCLSRYDQTLGHVEECAKDPNTPTSQYEDTYACDTFEKYDGGSTGLNAELLLCVRENCSAAEDAPCRPTCAIQGAAQPCASCMNDSCKQYLHAICADRAGGVFTQAGKCAEKPDLHFDNCSNLIDDYDAGYYDGGDLATRRNNFRQCVSDLCLRGDTPACKTCPVTYTHPETQEKYELSASPCGRCVLEKCYPDLLRCCEDSDCRSTYVDSKVASCAYPFSPRQPGCISIYQSDAGAGGLPECLRTSCSDKCAP
jgi:hypothetical protein